MSTQSTQEIIQALRRTTSVSKRKLLDAAAQRLADDQAQLTALLAQNQVLREKYADLQAENRRLHQENFWLQRRP